MNFVEEKAVLLLSPKHYAWDGKKMVKTRGTRTNYPSDVSDEEWVFALLI